MAKDGSGFGSKFVEQTLFLPGRLWDRVETMCDATDKEPSELVADALRLLLAGGVPTAPASIGGTTTSSDTPEVVAADQTPVDTADIDEVLGTLYQEPLDSQRLRDLLGKIMRSVEQKDQFTERHSESVADLARKLAETIGLQELEVKAIELGGLVHDLGKSQISDGILGKQGRLTPEQWTLVKRYPEFSAEMLSAFTELGEVLPIVRHHQERWDGSGYPEGLREEAIPVGAQIVGICDVYLVLTSDRAYRPGLSPEIARRTIEGGIGRLWNPDLAEVLLRKVLN